MFLLPGGAIGSVVTWFATRKERKVDVLSKLQESIDLLTRKYTEVLDENVQLKADNAKLLANQEIMNTKIDYLTNQVRILTQQLNNQGNEKSHQGKNPSHPGSRRVPVRSVRPVKQADGVPADTDGQPVADPGASRSGRKGRVRQPSVQLPEPPAGDDGAEGDVRAVDPGSAGTGDDPDAEPH